MVKNFRICSSISKIFLIRIGSSMSKRIMKKSHQADNAFILLREDPGFQIINDG